MEIIIKLFIKLDELINIGQLDYAMKYDNRSLIMDKNYYLHHWIAVLLLRGLIGNFALIVIGSQIYDNIKNNIMPFVNDFLLNIGVFIIIGFMGVIFIKRVANISIFIGEDINLKKILNSKTALVGIFMYALLMFSVVGAYTYIVSESYVEWHNYDKNFLAVMLSLIIILIYIFREHIRNAWYLNKNGLFLTIKSIENIPVKIDDKEIVMDIKRDVLLLRDDGSVYYLNDIAGKGVCENVEEVNIINYTFKWNGDKWIKSIKHIKNIEQKQVD